MLTRFGGGYRFILLDFSRCRHYLREWLPDQSMCHCISSPEKWKARGFDGHPALTYEDGSESTIHHSRWRYWIDQKPLDSVDESGAGKHGLPGLFFCGRKIAKTVLSR
ncbi:hypothetical protein OAF34_01540 [Pirellulaceae bacterium]|nr:hypothetical protein [Pirellulaceae bacterium]